MPTRILFAPGGVLDLDPPAATVLPSRTTVAKFYLGGAITTKAAVAASTPNAIVASAISPLRRDAP